MILQRLSGHKSHAFTVMRNELIVYTEIGIAPLIAANRSGTFRLTFPGVARLALNFAFQKYLRSFINLVRSSALDLYISVLDLR